jgi:predicted RNase H-like HicB family nuclease
VAKCQGLPGCISQGKTKKDVIKNIEEAITTYVVILKEDNLPIPPKGNNRANPTSTIPLKISARTCVKVFTKNGFYIKNRTAAEIVSRHIILRRDKPFTQLVIPICRRLDRETLMLIIKISGFTTGEFMQLLYEIRD